MERFKNQLTTHTTNELRLQHIEAWYFWNVDLRVKVILFMISASFSKITFLLNCRSYAFNLIICTFHSSIKIFSLSTTRQSIDTSCHSSKFSTDCCRKDRQWNNFTFYIHSTGSLLRLDLPLPPTVHLPEFIAQTNLSTHSCKNKCRNWADMNVDNINFLNSCVPSWERGAWWCKSRQHGQQQGWKWRYVAGGDQSP